MSLKNGRSAISRKRIAQILGKKARPNGLPRLSGAKKDRPSDVHLRETEESVARVAAVATT
jgi:hypothetical protein